MEKEEIRTIEEWDSKIDNTIGVIAYITLLGFIVAFVLNNNKEGKEKDFGAFHLRQSLGLLLIGFTLAIAVSITTILFLLISPLLGVLVYLLNFIVSFGVIALIIIGIINAVNRKKKELPIIGEFIEKILKNTFE